MGQRGGAESLGLQEVSQPLLQTGVQNLKYLRSQSPKGWFPEQLLWLENCFY